MSELKLNGRIIGLIAALCLFVAAIFLILERPAVSIDDLLYPKALRTKIESDGYITLTTPESEWKSGTIIGFSISADGKIARNSVQILGHLSDSGCGYQDADREVVSTDDRKQAAYKISNTIKASGNFLQNLLSGVGFKAMLERTYTIELEEVSSRSLNLLSLAMWEERNLDKVRVCIEKLSRDDIAVITSTLLVKRGRISVDASASTSASVKNKAGVDVAQAGSGELNLDMLYYGYKGVINLRGGFHSLPLNDMYVMTKNTVIEVVYFPKESAKLIDEAVERVDKFIDLAGAKGGVVTLIGHDDASGTVSESLAMSKMRIKSVLARFAEHGVMLEVNTLSFGEMRPALPTADGIAEARNRRVEMILEDATREVRPEMDPRYFLDNQFGSLGTEVANEN